MVACDPALRRALLSRHRRYRVRRRGLARDPVHRPLPAPTVRLRGRRAALVASRRRLRVPAHDGPLSPVPAHPLTEKPMETQRIRIEQHSAIGMLWFGAWLFTIGFLHLMQETDREQPGAEPEHADRAVL